MDKEWEPIETAPEDGTAVLVFAIDEDEHIICVASFNDKWRVEDVWGYEYETSLDCVQPIYWMPLPSPPKAIVL